MWTYKNVKVRWLGHDGFLLQGSKTVMIDPLNASGDYRPDILLISHEHSDHLNEADIKKFAGPSTTIIASKPCEGALRKVSVEKKFVAPNTRTEVKGDIVETNPAYNLNKYREPGKVFHPKEDGRVGWIVTLDGVRFYHAGDSDATPAMKGEDVDVAFLPVSGTYVMTAEEAAEAAKALKAKVIVPMHVAAIIGTMADAERFKKLVGTAKTVQILEKE